MSDRFTKLESNCENHLIIPSNKKKQFSADGAIDSVFVEKTMDFAYEMCFGKGDHRSNRSGGTKERLGGEKFADTFQGKLAEYGIYQYLKSNRLAVDEPDLTVEGKGKWDTVDIECYGRRISIKSTKAYGQLMLLETKDWDENGIYLPNKESNQGTYDYFALLRMKPYCEELLREHGLLKSDFLEKEVLKEYVVKEKWKYEISGVIARSELKHIINQNHQIHKNEILGEKTRMDADNYYVLVSEMHSPDQLVKRLKEYFMLLSKR